MQYKINDTLVCFDSINLILYDLSLDKIICHRIILLLLLNHIILFHHSLRAGQQEKKFFFQQKVVYKM